MFKCPSMNVTYVSLRLWSALPCHVQTTDEGTRAGNEWRVRFHVYVYASLYMLIFVLCWCVLTVLCLFIIKLAETCRARPPREATQTPSSKKCTSFNYIHLLGVTFCLEQKSEPTPPTQRPQTSWCSQMEAKCFGQCSSLRWKQT